MVKSHQQIAQANNLYSQKQPVSQQNQAKFLSKSPNTQNKLMAQTNYGKFKVIPTQNAQISSNQPYTRGPGMPQSNAQYLPKLGGTSQGPSSQAYSGVPTQSASAQNQYFQQMQKTKVPT